MIVPNVAKFSARVTLTVIVVVSAGQAEARMYQWSNAATGTVQLSGSPPAWYRSTSSGPRVFVFDDGQLIDDTAVPLPEEQRQVMRDEAFGEIDRGGAAEIPDEPQDALTHALEDAARDGIDVNAVTEAFTAELQETDEDRAGENGIMVEQTVAELKALLDAWDSRRLNEVKSLLRNATSATE